MHFGGPPVDPEPKNAPYERRRIPRQRTFAWMNQLAMDELVGDFGGQRFNLREHFDRLALDVERTHADPSAGLADDVVDSFLCGVFRV